MSDKQLFAYGDRDGDGMLQMAFTLKIAPGAIGKEAARLFAEKHGLKDPLVATMESCGSGYTYFVVYGKSEHSVDLNHVHVPELVYTLRSHDEIDSLLLERIAHKVIVVGACTGADAHTVGIDAIMNIKGFAGEKGLESYKSMSAHNLGAQVDNDALVDAATKLNADVILVSQVITQRDCHKDNSRELVQKITRLGLRQRFMLLLGGPRVDHKLALELGFDAGFGTGTTPRDVASYIAEHLHYPMKAP